MVLGIGCHTVKNTDHVPTPQSLILVEKADNPQEKNNKHKKKMIYNGDKRNK